MLAVEALAPHPSIDQVAQSLYPVVEVLLITLPDDHRRSGSGRAQIGDSRAHESGAQHTHRLDIARPDLRIVDTVLLGELAGGEKHAHERARLRTDHQVAEGPRLGRKTCRPALLEARSCA